MNKRPPARGVPLALSCLTLIAFAVFFVGRGALQSVSREFPDPASWTEFSNPLERTSKSVMRVYTYDKPSKTGSSSYSRALRSMFLEEGRRPLFIANSYKTHDKRLVGNDSLALVNEIVDNFSKRRTLKVLSNQPLDVVLSDHFIMGPEVRLEFDKISFPTCHLTTIRQPRERVLSAISERLIKGGHLGVDHAENVQNARAKFYEFARTTGKNFSINNVHYYCLHNDANALDCMQTYHVIVDVSTRMVCSRRDSPEWCAADALTAARSMAVTNAKGTLLDDADRDKLLEMMPNSTAVEDKFYAEVSAYMEEGMDCQPY